MDCPADCTKLEWEREGWWCLKFNRFLGLDSPPQMTSDCEVEAIENERINKRDEVREDKL